ncbi:MAG TPA: hypothetical protein VK179_14345 [Bacteroidales bacterium]|nr:hypothetical protein [Bacteroidales bacterium]
MKGLTCIIFGLSGLMAVSCHTEPVAYEQAGNANIFPDYSAITIPCNIAPLNFDIQEKADKYQVTLWHPIDNQAEKLVTVRSSDGKIRFGQRIWKECLSVCRGGVMIIDIYGKKDGKWYKYKSIVDSVASDPVDRFLVYRLIEPGYETWNKMGIYERDLQNFKERTVIKNEMTGGNCINCHSFCRNSQDKMLLHVRGEFGGTLIKINDRLQKADTKTKNSLSACVYPSWHPGGRYVAFSVNRIVQSFHALSTRKIEVVDTLSDIVLYDATLNKVITIPQLADSRWFETFPSWSPDGKTLYYCAAPFQNYRDFENIRYNLMSISFNAETGVFGETSDTIIAAGKDGLSVSFPRVSPDSNYLLFCKSGYGNFTIWHKDSDLELLNLKNKQITVPGINSDESESYHSWSSKGRWIVFSSRRIDGLYTRLYISYFDTNGNFHKPFLLPQQDPGSNQLRTKSYNVPEFIESAIKPGPHSFARAIRSKAEPSSAD